MASNNKENIPVTPNKSNRITVENSPASLKKALKPISPNKNGHREVGKLNFLQSDNFDDQFDYIHNTQEQIQLQLNIIESQTKQTGSDVGQLVDRLKNNNSNLNKLLEQIASYSDEVITEGNATKHDISNIIEILDTFTEKLDKPLKSDTDDLIKQIHLKLSAFNSSDSRTLDKLDAKLTKSLDISGTIQSQLEKVDNASNLAVVNVELEKLRSILTKGQSTSTINDIKETITTENENLSKLFLGKAVEDQAQASAEAAKLLALISEHESKIENSSTKKQTEILRAMENLQSLILSQDQAKESKFSSIYKSSELIRASFNDGQSVILNSLQQIKDSVSTKSMADQIVDPIIKELNSVALKSTSTEPNTRSISQPDSQKIMEKLNTISSNLIELKDRRILDLEAQLSQNNILLETSLECTELNNLKLDLESKVRFLEQKYSQLKLEYTSKFEDLQHLTSQYDEFLHKGDQPNMVIDEGINLKKVRQLHVHKMKDLQDNPVSNGRSKRIVSSPLIQDTKSYTKPYVNESLTIIDSD